MITYRVMVLVLCAMLGVGACTKHDVNIQAPDKPIEINLNINIDHRVKVEIDKDLDEVMSNSDIF
ncbi:MAG: YnbE family lipoprotein [Rickettsiales bacterium]|nr:YnbE family lipoprotein [Rickettsiales bacterium]